MAFVALFFIRAFICPRSKKIGFLGFETVVC